MKHEITGSAKEIAALVAALQEWRVEWVSRVGREQAHKMVDRYWEEG